MLTITADPIEILTVATLQAGDLSSPIEQQALVEFVNGGIQEARAIDRALVGHDVAFRITLDGLQIIGALLTAVSRINALRSVLTVDFDLEDGVLQWIMQALLDRSPVLSGGYRRGHLLLADGAVVTNIERPPAAREYVFLNTVPYARRIEIGKTESGRDFVLQVPNRIYERTAKDAQVRFGNQADISFGYVETPQSYRLTQNQTSRQFLPGRVYRSPSVRRDRAAGSSVPSPAIAVTFQR